MIYSRSPEQYDPAPFLDPAGDRYSKDTAPRNAKWAPRLFLVPTDDIEPVLDRGYGRKTREAVELLLRENPQAINDLLWAPRSGEDRRHNQILSSIRSSGNTHVKADVYRLWLQTLEEFDHAALIALSPGLTSRKIAEAKLILSRLLKAHEGVL